LVNWFSDSKDGQSTARHWPQYLAIDEITAAVGQMLASSPIATKRMLTGSHPLQ